jgi:hypothetical protein
MSLFTRIGPLAWALVLLCVALFSPRFARAEAPSPRATPVHVIGIDSDDAEDQADALTGAIRSRVRVAPGWSLQETSHSLSMLTAALRCPQKPDAACLQRIGDQIHTDRFVWGVMTKSSGNQVTADIHLWSRGKPDTTVRETYSDNLKDQNDETLRKIATHAFERLTGTVSSGTVTVHAGEATGFVLINGQRKATLEHGAATIELPAGSYLVEVRSPGSIPTKQQVTINAGADTPVTMKLSAQAAAPAPAASGGKGLSTRKIVAWSAIVVGAGALVVGTVEGIRFLGLKDDLNANRNHVDRSVTDVCAPEQAGNPYAVDACSQFKDAKSARTLGLLFGGVGVALAATGVILLVTDHPKEPAADVAKREPIKPRVDLTPSLSPKYGGLDLHVTF